MRDETLAAVRIGGVYKRGMTAEDIATDSRPFRRSLIVVAVVCLAAWFVVTPRPTRAAAGLPRPDHVVIVIEENHSFQEIYNSSSAPFINSLVPEGAAFT